MVDLDYISLFSSAKFSGTLIFTWVFVWAAFFLFRPRKLGKQSIDLYWRGAAFFAEILVIGGLLGLFTFAGRARIEFIEKYKIERAQESESRVTNKILVIMRNLCLPNSVDRPPFRRYRSNVELCELAQNYGPIYDEKLDWEQAKKKLSKIRDGKFVDYQTRETIEVFESDIDAMIKARRSRGQNSELKGTYQLGSSWEFIMFCAVSAMFGVSIKCARAFNEFLSEFRKWRNNHCSS